MGKLRPEAEAIGGEEESALFDYGDLFRQEFSDSAAGKTNFPARGMDQDLERLKRELGVKKERLIRITSVSLMGRPDLESPTDPTRIAVLEAAMSVAERDAEFVLKVNPQRPSIGTSSKKYKKIALWNFQSKNVHSPVRFVAKNVMLHFSDVALLPARAQRASDCQPLARVLRLARPVPTVHRALLLGLRATALRLDADRRPRHDFPGRRRRLSARRPQKGDGGEVRRVRRVPARQVQQGEEGHHGERKDNRDNSYIRATRVF